MEILKANGGCVVGFNKLRKMRKTGEFHPNYLRFYLDKMQKEGKIAWESDKKRDKYCIVSFAFDTEFEKYTKDLEVIDTKLLYNKDLNYQEKLILVRKYMDLAIRKYNSITIGQIHDEITTKSKTKIQRKENAKKKLWNLMITHLNLIELKEDRIRVLDSLLI